MSAQAIKGFIIVLIVGMVGLLAIKVLTPKNDDKTSLVQTNTEKTALNTTTNTTGPMISLSPLMGSYNVGEEFTLSVVLDTKGETVMGAEAVLLFDPTLLGITDDKIVAGSLFPSYPMKRAVEGKLRLVGVISDPNQKQFTGKGVLGTVTFTALKKGTANVTIDFTEGATNKSNVLKLGDKDSGINFLKKVEDGKYIIN